MLRVFSVQGRGEDMDEKRKKLLLRILWMIGANMILGMGIALLRLSSFGTDPFTCMNLGVSSHLPISFAVYQMCFNVLLFIPVFILDRKSFGIGALTNMLLLGYFVEFFMFVFSMLGLTIEGLTGNLIMRIATLVLGVLVVCFGVALYMACDLGAAPYDRLPVIVETYSHGKVKYKWARVGQDVISAAIGLATGSVVGVGTVIVALFTGPIVSFFRETVVAGIMKNLS